MRLLITPRCSQEYEKIKTTAATPLLPALGLPDYNTYDIATHYRSCGRLVVDVVNMFWRGRILVPGRADPSHIFSATRLVSHCKLMFFSPPSKLARFASRRRASAADNRVRQPVATSSDEEEHPSESAEDEHPSESELLTAPRARLLMLHAVAPLWTEESVTEALSLTQVCTLRSILVSWLS